MNERRTVPTAGARCRALMLDGVLDLPPVGGGDTAERWRALVTLARDDASVARLAEAHVDGVQILAESGRAADPARLLGVWASEGPDGPVTAELRPGGEMRLRGVKAFCGGAGLVDDALVTARLAHRAVLLLVPVAGLGPARIDRSGWATPALADTSTALVDLTGLELDGDAVVGPDGWYTERPGFWHGAIGPAACWAGIAAGLVDHATRHVGPDPHARAHLGALHAERWAMEAALDRAGDEIDRSPGDGAVGRARALTVRHLVERGAAEVQERFGRALGPRPLVSDPEVIARDGALRIYRRQSHAERDLADLGGLLRASHPFG